MAELVRLTDEQLKELQEKSLEIAQYIVQFCEQHGLRIYFYAGSLLGAVREHGFISWDDDIDLVMPAPDYQKLIELWDKEADTERFSLCMQTRTYNDHTLSSSIRDNRTTFITDSTEHFDVNQGLSVDLGTIHACPRTRIGRKFQLLCAAGCSLFKAGRVPARQSKAVTFAAKMILGIFRTEGLRYFIWNTLEKIASVNDKHWESAKYVREFSMFPYITWVFPREWFDKPVYHKFEDIEVPIPIGAKGYLKKRYGDYMKLPPEKDRHPEHRIVFMDLNTPYKEYRGKKYFQKEKK